MNRKHVEKHWQRAVCISLGRQSSTANLEANFRYLLDAPSALIQWIHCHVQRCRWSHNLSNETSRISAQGAPLPFWCHNLNHLHNDAAIIWSQWEPLGFCSPTALYLRWGKKSNLWEERCRTFPLRRGFPSHATRLLTDCNKVCSDSSLPKRQQQRRLSRGDGTPNFLCGHQKPFNHRYFELSEIASLYPTA